MKQQLLTLQQLIAGMDPELYRHLGACHSGDETAQHDAVAL